MGFCSLQHMKNRRSTRRELAWLATFRLQGLVTLLAGSSLSVPCRFCFTPAALLGFALRSFLLSQDIRYVSVTAGPPAVSSCRCSRRRSGGPARQAAAPGHRSRRESLAATCGISTATAGCSLGVCPSRASQRRPRPGFRPVSSHAPCSHCDKSQEPPAPQSIDRPSPGPIRTPQQATMI
jgi:hypothetical protein